MDFGTSISTCFKKYVDFKGRASRSEFWWFALLYYVVYVAGIFLLGEIGGLAVLALVLPYLAASVRRLHDTNRSGWWFLLSLTGIGVLVLIFFWASDGDQGENEYGARPAA